MSQKIPYQIIFYIFFLVVLFLGFTFALMIPVSGNKIQLFSFTKVSPFIRNMIPSTLQGMPWI